MERLPFPGVTNATNAFAVTDDAKTAYLHDPRADIVVAIDLSTGSRRILKWDDRNFAHRRWVCYSLFAMSKGDDDYVSILFFNQHKKVFCLVHFIINGDLLVKVQTNALNTSSINKERLAYSVSKDGKEVQIIFYERFSSSSASSPSLATNPPARLRFILCTFSPSSMRVTTSNGLLPPNGQWELPFISNHSLHFINTASTPHLFISYSRMESSSWESVAPQPIGIMATNSAYPPRKALWCNAWCRGVGWFSVTEKIENENGAITRKTSLWRLDVDSEWKWRKHPLTLDTPEYTRSLSLRLTPPPSGSLVNGAAYGFIHADWEQREAALFRVKLDEAKGPFRSTSQRLSESGLDVDDDDSSSECLSEGNDDEDDGLVLRRSNHKGRYIKTPPREALTDLMCPICLDTYNDARTLNCGHSMCWECIEQMRISVKNETIRCPNCRQPTTIPPGGLPINYGLKDAISALSRLIVTRRGCHRCNGCRDKTETDKMWLCITCYRNPAITVASSLKRSDPVSIRRPSSLYITSSPSPNSANDSALLSPGAHSLNNDTQPTDTPVKSQSSLALVFNEATPSGSSTQEQRLIHHSYCASCLLNHHAGHEYEGLVKIKERSVTFAKRREEYGRQAAAMIDEMREQMKQTIEETVCGPLLKMAHAKLDSLTDCLSIDNEAETERRSEAVLSKLSEICDIFGRDSSQALHDLLERCKGSDSDTSRRQSIRSAGHSTEL